jgi:superfamily II DNA or RNA helicase
MIELRPYQQRAVDALREHVRAGRKRVLLVCPTGGGKCLGPDVQVLRYDGSIVRAADVKVGDQLMGPDSKPRLVLSTTRGVGPMYRIRPIKGEPWTCNDVHVLTLINTTTGSIVDIPLNEYMKANKTFKHEYKLFMPGAGIDFPRVADPPIDPYFLGLWFGDGRKNLNSVEICKPDVEVERACLRVAEEYGCTLKTYRPTGKCPCYRIVNRKGAQNPVLQIMREMVGGDVNVPPSVMYGSHRVRSEFLAGFLDADGHTHNGFIEICQKRDDYADAIAFISRSLGLRVTRRIKVVNGVPYHRLGILGNIDILPMRIPRKIPPRRKQIKDATRTGFSVETIGDGEYAGFELDGDGRFLLGDFTVTHNTVLASAIIHSARARSDARVLFIAHRIELIDQTVRQLARWGVTEVGVMRADDERTNALAPVQVATIQTLARRDLPPASIVFVDEAHRAPGETYRRVLDAYPDAFKIGLTATPCRLDGKPLGDLFDALEQAATYEQLIADGFVCEPIVYAPKDPVDLSRVHRRHGDFAEDELDEAMNRPHVVGNLVEEWRANAGGRRTVVFAVSVAHSRAIAERFRDAGVRAEHLDGTTPLDERREILAKLDAGELDVVTNCAVLCEGWDQPSVKCAVIARPTLSVALYMQMAGRVLRPWNGVQPVILDHAGNVERHGLPHEDRHWSLSGSPTRTRTSGTKERVRICPKCFAYVKKNPCELCGHEEPVKSREVVEDASAKLTQWKGDPRRVFFELELDRARSKGYKPGFASAKYREKYGQWPPWSWSQEARAAFEKDERWQWRLNQREIWKREISEWENAPAPTTETQQASEATDDSFSSFVDEWLKQ